MYVNVIREITPTMERDGRELPFPRLTVSANLGGPVITELPVDAVEQAGEFSRAANSIRDIMSRFSRPETSARAAEQLRNAISEQKSRAIGSGGDQYTWAAGAEEFCVERKPDGSPVTVIKLDASKPQVRFKLEFKPSSERYSTKHPVQQVGVFHNILRKLGLNPEDAVSTTLVKPITHKGFARQKQEILATDWKPLSAA